MRIRGHLLALKSIFRALSVFIVLSVVLTTAGTHAADAQTYSYNEIVVEGNARIDAASILRFAELPASGSVSAAEINSAYRRIADTSLFENLEIIPEGNRLFISVVEYPIINEISIEGNRRITDQVLQTAVKSTVRRVYVPSQAEEDAAAIAEIYRVQGRFAAIVTPKIIRRTDNRVDLVFEVVEGRVIETERISFVGNREFSGFRLRRELASKQAGLLRPFVKTDTYVSERIEQDREELTNFYFNRGYVDFEILSVSAEIAAERDAFFVTFTVREGQQYRYGEITASTEIEGVDTPEYLREFRGKSGDIYSPKFIDDAIERMEHLASSRNEQFVFVEPQFKRNIETQTLDVNFRIYRGPRNFIERIDITGNTTTYDRVIRREFRVAEGDPFNPREISEATDRIRALQFFSSVTVDTEPGSTPDQAVVKVNVEESPTGALSFGATWAQDAGFAGKVSLSERNLLGRGQLLSFALETGKNASYTLTFVEPRFLDRDVSLQLRTSLLTTRGLGNRFTTEQWLLTGAVGFPISETGRLTLGVGYNTFEFDRFFSLSHILAQDFERGKGDRVFLDYLLDFDTRRAGFDTVNGYKVSLSQSFAFGLDDDTKVITTNVSFGAQRALFNELVTVTGVLEGGVVHDLDDRTRIRDRVRANSNLIRGFESNGIGPRDFIVSEIMKNEIVRLYTDPLGGNYFAALRLESRFPIGLPEEIGIEGGVFFDAGSVWGLDEVECSNHGFPTDSEQYLLNQDKARDACVVDDGFNLRTTVGISMFWDTFLGPLRMNLSRPVRFESYDRTQTFDLTVATQF